MSHIQVEKYLKITLKIVLYAVLVTPLLIWYKTLFPFITGKTIFFRLAIELAILIYAALAMLSPKYRPRMTKLSWSIVFFGIIIFLTGLTGVNFYKTFWGTIERGEGFLTISHLIIYFLILTWTLKSKKEWLNYFTGSISVGLWVACYAVFQRLNIETFLGIKIINSGEGRLSSTIGNAAFLGAFVLSQFWLSLWLFLKRKQLVWKIVFALTCLINLYVMWQTQTRGAVLAWVLTFGLACLVYVFKSKDKLKKYFALGIVVLMFLAGSGALLFPNSSLVQSNATLRRLVGISKNDITTESRLLAWDTSWKGWQDRFLLGYGWENYNIAYNKYFHAEVYKDAGSQLWFDRAHNTIFDIAVATGIFGLISYLLIFFLAFKYLYTISKTNFETALIFGSLLLAHFIQNIFVFDVLSTFIVLFSVFAFISIYSFKNSDEVNKKYNFSWLTYLPIVIAVVFLAYIFNIKPLKANLRAVDALISVNSQKENLAIEYFQQAINMQTYQTPELRHKLADNIIYYNNSAHGLSEEEIIKNYNICISGLKKNIEKNPSDVQEYLYLMATLNKTARYDTDYYEQVIKIGQQAIPLSPTRPQIYFEMGQAEVSRGNFDKGIKYFQYGLDLYPENLESHWNLIAAYNLAQDFDKADEELKYVIGRGFNVLNEKNLNRLYNVYLMSKRLDKMIEIVEIALQIDPSAKNYARLAAIYKQTDDFVKAREAVEQALKLDPSMADEAQAFLESLK